MSIEQDMEALYEARMVFAEQGGVLALVPKSSRGAWIEKLVLFAENESSRLLGSIDDQIVSEHMSDLVQTNGDNFSKVALIQQYAEAICAIPWERSAANCLQLPGISQFFSVYLDMAIGARSVMSVIDLAEMSLKGTVSEELTEIFSESSKLNLGKDEDDIEGLAEATDYFLQLRGGAQEFARLLVQDKSAYLLLDCALEEVGMSSNVLNIPLDLPDFVLIGARTAVEAYKRIYPLTAKPV